MPLRSVTDGGIALLCFPPYDHAFATLASQRLSELPERVPDALQAALRRAYPNATVRPRESLAAFRPDAAWYVYRDGRYGPSGEDPWWDEPESAWVDIDGDGRYVDANPAALELLGLTRDELLATRTGDLADPAVAELVPWTWHVLRETGEIHSTSILAAHGARARMAIEYRMVADGGGPGRHRSHLRAIPLVDAEPTPASV